MASRPLDIFVVLSAINRKDYTFFENLKPHEFKSIQPLVLLKWMGGTTDPIQLQLLNLIANPHIFELQHHRELLIKLLMSCSPGENRRYQWIKGRKKESTTVILSVVEQFYNYSRREALQVMHIISNDDILAYADAIHLDKTKLSLLRRELKDRCQ